MSREPPADSQDEIVMSPQEAKDLEEDEPVTTSILHLEKHIQGSEPPDGGFAAWSVVVGVWCTSFCSFGWLNSVGIFQDYYQTHNLRQYSSSEIAWIPSLQIFFMLACGPVMGWIYDRHGPRYLILVGSFLHVLGVMMTSISKHYYSIVLAQGVCSAIGAASIFQPAVSTIGGWFKKRSALAFGVVSTGSSIGGVIFPIMISHLIREVGYGWAMRTAAFVILSLLIIANLTVKCRVQPVPHALSHEDLIRPFHEMRFVLVVGGFAFLTFGIVVPINYLVVQATAQGMSLELGQYLISILNAASFFGRLSSGIIADKVGRYNVFIVVCYVSAILVLGLWLPASGNAAFIVFAACFGFSSGAYISISPVLVAQISPLKELGYRIGLLFGFGALPGLTTAPIAGAILSDSGGSFSNVKIYGGVCITVGTTLVLLARLSKTGLKLFAKF